MCGTRRIDELSRKPPLYASAAWTGSDLDGNIADQQAIYCVQSISLPWPAQYPFEGWYGGHGCMLDDTAKEGSCARFEKALLRFVNRKHSYAARSVDCVQQHACLIEEDIFVTAPLGMMELGWLNGSPRHFFVAAP